MYRVMQYHRTFHGYSTRCWNYKTQTGARRRVWLCNLEFNNIMTYYYFVTPEDMCKTVANSYFLPNSKFWDGFDEYLKSYEVQDDK